MATTSQVASLEYYQEMIALGSELYSIAKNSNREPSKRIREHALDAVLNLASGLGFWEKEWKIAHFERCKKNLISLSALLDVALTVGDITEDERDRLSSRVNDMVKRVSGLIGSTDRRGE